MSARKGDRLSDDNEGKLDGGVAGARAIVFPSLSIAKASVCSPVIAQAKPLPLLQATRLRLAGAGWGWAIGFGVGLAIGAVALRVFCWSEAGAERAIG